MASGDLHYNLAADLSPTGTPFAVTRLFTKAPCEFGQNKPGINATKAFVAAYLSEDAARQALGNDASVSKITLPHAIPVGINQDISTPCYLMLRDARFLTINPDLLEEVRNPFFTTASVANLPIALEAIRDTYQLACSASDTNPHYMQYGPRALTRLAHDETNASIEECIALLQIHKQAAQNYQEVAEQLYPHHPYIYDFSSPDFWHCDHCLRGNAFTRIYELATMKTISSDPKEYSHSSPRMDDLVESRVARRYISLGSEYASTAFDLETLVKRLQTKEQAISQSSEFIVNGFQNLQQIIAEHDDGAMEKTREDAGAIVYGARKFTRSAPLVTDDVDAMEHAERVKFILKENVWPRPDWEQWREEGRCPLATLFVKTLYDSLPASPATAGNNTSRRSLKYRQQTILDGKDDSVIEHQRNFVGAIKVVQTALDGCQTIDDVATACYIIRSQMGISGAYRQLNDADTYQSDRLIYGGSRSHHKTFPAQDSGRYSYIGWYPYTASNEPDSMQTKAMRFCDGAGHKFLEALPNTVLHLDDSIDFENDSYEARLLSPASKAIAKAMTYADQKAITDAGGIAEYLKTGNDASSNLWCWLESKRPVKNNDEANESGESRFSRPHLDNLERTGQDWRNSKDVDEETMRRAFSFKAIQYGKSLSKKGSESERQAFLNLAFDAFADLASTMQVPPTMLSLNGTLAVAFGARGKGGKNPAAAHYEPVARFADETTGESGVTGCINLTRMNGAGSLAHEIWHAISHSVAKETDLSQVQLMGQIKDRPPKGDHGGLPQAFWDLVHGLKHRIRTIDDMRAEGLACTIYRYEEKDGESVQIRENVNMPDYMRYRIEDTFNSYLYELARMHDFDHAGLKDAHIEIMERVTSEQNWKNFNADATAAEYLTTFRIAGTGKCLPAGDEKYLDYFKGGLTRLQDFLEKRLEWVNTRENEFQEALTTNPNDPYSKLPSWRTDTEYFRAAKELDSTRSKSYWTTAEEMGARAFEAYIQDKLTQQGLRSDFLVHGCVNDLWGGKYKPYPEGNERAEINQRFDQFLDKWRPDLIHLLNPVAVHSNTREAESASALLA